MKIQQNIIELVTRPADPRDREGGENDGYESEDVNDFIVDEDGQPIVREKTKKRHIFSDSARSDH